MIKYQITYIVISLFCCFAISASGGAKKVNQKTPKEGTEKVLYALDFSQNADGPAESVLKKMGFQIAKDMADPYEVKIFFKKGRFYVQALEPVFGLAVKNGLKVNNPSKIRLTWGVDAFPKGAGYGKGVNNEAMMIYVYFGDKKMSSGSFFIPASPYFLGLYLSEDDPLKKPFIGKHFKEQGRFISLGNPEPGEEVVSVFDIATAFKECFKKKAVPHISGLTIEVDTSYVKPGTSKAFVKKIEFLQ